MLLSWLLLTVHTVAHFHLMFMSMFTLRWFCDRLSLHYIAAYLYIMMNPQKWPRTLLLRKTFSVGSNVSVKDLEEKVRRYSSFRQQIAVSTLGISSVIYNCSKKSWLLLQCSRDWKNSLFGRKDEDYLSWQVEKIYKPNIPS